MFPWGNYSLSFGAFFIAIFVSYVWKTSSALQEIAQGTERFKIAVLWVIAIKFIAPIVILLILLSSIF